MINYKTITPKFKEYIYELSQIEIEELIGSFLQDKFKNLKEDIKLEIGCYTSSNDDVYIEWIVDEKNEDIIDKIKDFETNQIKHNPSYKPLNLSPNENFLNRDSIFEQIFKTPYIYII